MKLVKIFTIFCLSLPLSLNLYAETKKEAPSAKSAAKTSLFVRLNTPAENKKDIPPMQNTQKQQKKQPQKKESTIKNQAQKASSQKKQSSQQNKNQQAKKAPANTQKLNTDKKESIVQKAKTPEQKTKPAVVTPEQQLQNFVDSVNIRLLSIDIVPSGEESIVQFKYMLDNKTNKDIKNIHWSTTYKHLNQEMMVHDIPIRLEHSPLQSQSSRGFVFPINWNQIPEIAQQILVNPQGAVDAVYFPYVIEFTDGSSINVQ